MSIIRKLIQLIALSLVIPSIISSQVLTKPLFSKYSPTLHEIVNGKIEQTKALSPKRTLHSVAIDNEGNEIFGVIIKTDDVNELKALNININAEFKKFVTARITLDEIMKVADLNSVSYIETGEVLYPTNDIAGATIGADLLHSGYFNSTIYKGSGVIVCIIDTGIDWDHPDFRNASDQTKSRIQYIWDQTLTKSVGEKTPEDRDGTNFAGLDYGVEYSKTDIENELDGSPASFVREEDTNGHGTHVAGSAAGNGAALSTLKYAGIAPEADIVVVKAGNGSFSNANIINALAYAQKISTQLSKPIVVNMSLGGHLNAHDGTSSLDQAVDNFVGTGRTAVISAGNEGSNNIHITGTVNASSTANITFTLPSYAAISGSDNDYFGFDLWFDTGGNISATVTTPHSHSATQTAGTDGSTETADGSIYLYNYIDSNNSDREVYLYVDDNNSSITPVDGTWTLAVTNNSAGAMVYHGWLFGSSMNAALNSGNSQYTIGSPGTASGAITVGSFVSRWNWYAVNGGSYNYGSTDYSDDISSFSSIGPRRDGENKPDIAAPGQAIVSALSSTSSADASEIIVAGKYRKNQGTSMSSPIAAGAVALLLQQNSNLTNVQVKSLLINNTNSDTYTGATFPDNYWGYGKLNILKAMVKSVNPGVTPQNETLAYDGWASTSGVYITTSQKTAVRFTPSFTGKVTGLFFHLILGSTITSPVYAEIWSDNAGLPGLLLGSTVSFAYDAVAGNTWNFINMQGSGVSVNSGTDYHAVIYWTSTSGSNTAIEYDNTTVATRSSLYSGSWGSYPKAFRIRPIITTSESALPVELALFSANVNNKKVALSWETATEINNYGFDIERTSAEKKEWTKIGFIGGAGNSNSPKNYSFVDEAPNGGNKLLYRLKQIDLDGNFEYSPEVDVELNFAMYSLSQNFPNPFNPVTTISFEVPVKDKVKISLFDILGRKVYDLADEFFDVGVHKISLDGSKLSSGVYFVRMDASNFKDIKKITLLK